MPRVSLLALFLFLAPLAESQTPAPVRIACGQAAAYTDSAGNVWSADSFYNIGAPGINWSRTFSTTHAIGNTFDPTLYQHERWSSNDAPPLTYSIPAPAGPYTLNLLFAEDFATAAGQRQFNVLINGTQFLTNFDVFATAGGDFIAVTESFNVISTGTITIQFTHGSANNPAINAIDLEPGEPQPFVYTLPGLGTATFSMFIPPTCGPNDGTCSIQIQITAATGAMTCSTGSSGTITCVGDAGTLSLIKNVTLPTPQAITVPVVVVTAPTETGAFKIGERGVATINLKHPRVRAPICNVSGASITSINEKTVQIHVTGEVGTDVAWSCK